MIFNFEVKEIDYIGQVLAQRPYAEVKDLMDKIVMQANDTVLQSYGPPVPPPDEAEVRPK